MRYMFLKTRIQAFLVLTPHLNHTFRNEMGNPTDYLGSRLRLSNFACQELTSGISVGLRTGHNSIYTRALLTSC